MISLLINILVVVLVASLIYYICDAVPIPQPLNKIVKIVVIVIAVLVIIMTLLGLLGEPFPLVERRP